LINILDTAALISGVVQGCGIGPLMFLVYINDLATVFERYGIKVKLFADDVKLYIQILNYVHVLQLQQAVDALVAWVNEWQLSISVNKCCVLNVDIVTYSTCFSMDGLVVPAVESVRDLGVIVSCDLSPLLHTSNI